MSFLILYQQSQLIFIWYGIVYYCFNSSATFALLVGLYLFRYASYVIIEVYFSVSVLNTDMYKLKYFWNMIT